MIDVDGCMYMSSHCTLLKQIISFTFKVSHVTIDIATLCAVLVRGQMNMVGCCAKHDGQRETLNYEQRSLK